MRILEKSFDQKKCLAIEMYTILSRLESIERKIDSSTYRGNDFTPDMVTAMMADIPPPLPSIQTIDIKKKYWWTSSPQKNSYHFARRWQVQLAETFDRTIVNGDIRWETDRTYELEVFDSETNAMKKCKITCIGPLTTDFEVQEGAKKYSLQFVTVQELQEHSGK